MVIVLFRQLCNLLGLLSKVFKDFLQDFVTLFDYVQLNTFP